MPAAPIPDSLSAAFEGAHYVVLAPEATFTLRIGEPSAQLVQLMRDHAQDSATILTAFNPGAKPASAEANRKAQQSLRRDAQALGLPCIDGKNIAANRDGPSEPTVVVLGLNRCRAAFLARKFRQLAFVYAEASGVPELVWLCDL